jgi:hypothetical protein
MWFVCISTVMAQCVCIEWMVELSTRKDLKGFSNGVILYISAFAWRDIEKPPKTCQGRPFGRPWFEPVISQIPARCRCGLRRLVGYCNRFLGCHARSPSYGLHKTEIISIHVTHLKRAGLSPWHAKYCDLKTAKLASAWSVRTNSMFLWNIYKSMFVNLHLQGCW